MTLQEIYNIGISAGVGFLIIVILSIIKIPKIEINVWSFLARKFGNAINYELDQKLKSTNEKIDCLEQKIENTENRIEETNNKIDRNTAVNCRTRILRFGDEITHGQKHTLEHFNQILEDITDYDNYCAEHPEFPNKKTENTVKRIMEIYDKACEDNDFL